MSTIEQDLHHGGFNLLQIYEGRRTQPSISSKASGPLRVAVGILLEPEATVNVGSNSFSCAHYISRSREGKTEYFNYTQAPLFAVAVSAEALKHQEAQLASTLGLSKEESG